MYGPLLFDNERSDDERDALRERLADDPALAKGWAHWRAVRAELRTRLQERLSDRRLLVLYALDQEGRTDALTPEEVAALNAARDDIAAAVEAVPALQKVVERIQDEREAFEAVWEQHRGEVSAGTEAEISSAAGRTERAPRRPRSHDETARRRWGWRLTVAALVLGAAVLAVLYGPRDTSRTTVTAQASEQKTVEFGDGSTARLVGTSTLSYTPNMATAERRRVTLTRGRAYFDVAPKEDASFVVSTPSAQAEALGTTFGVATGNDTTEVVLVEGKVRVAAAGDAGATESVVLAPGERSTVRKGGTPTPPLATDLNRTLEWTGLFVFRSTTTAAIAERLSAHYGVTVTVAPVLADASVTGTFERDQPVAQVLRTVARTLGADVRTEGDTYRIEPSS